MTTILGSVAPNAHILFVVVGIDVPREAASRVEADESRSSAGIALAATLGREEARS